MRSFISIIFRLSLCLSASAIVALPTQTLAAKSAVVKKTRKEIRKARRQFTLDKLHVLTFSKDAPSNLIKQSSIDCVCKQIQKGKIKKIHNTQIDTHDATLRLSCDLPENYDKTIFIYVSGFAGNFSFNKYQFPCNSAHATYGLYNSGVITDAPCISFCAKQSHKRTMFNFGQTFDQSALDFIYQETIKINPKAKIVFIGVCIGATTILNYLANPEHPTGKFDNVQGIILECPGISFDEVMKEIEANYMPWLFKKFTPFILKAWFPSYKSKQPTILDHYIHIPSHIKILMGYVRHDKVTSSKGAKKIIAKLSECNEHLYAYEITDLKIKHGRISSFENFKKYIHAFLNEYKLEKSPVHDDVDLTAIKAF